MGINMRALTLGIVISCACLVTSQVTFRDVVIEQGTVRGYSEDNVGVYSYYGIPYASAPKGEHRFKAPLPPPSWNGVFNATTKNIICPQISRYIENYIELNRTEDCLIVNVFVPTTAFQSNIPVLVYIHPGGFNTGYGMMYNPAILAAKGMVVVNMNHRIGFRGFLCLGTEYAPGNSGLKDQVAALKWVKNNIAQFGGDPNNVLLTGGSAGSIASELHMLSPMSNGLFHKIALESGTAIAFNSVNFAPLDLLEEVANSHGVVTGQDVQQLEAFFRTLTDEQIDRGWATVGADMGLRPCIETHNLDGIDKFLDADPIDIIQSGNYETRLQIAGFSAMEGLGFLFQLDDIREQMQNNFSQLVPPELLNESQRIKDFYFPNGEITNREVVNFYTDTVFAYPHLQSARLHSHGSQPIFLYLWSYNGTVNLPDLNELPIWGPAHTSTSLHLMERDERRVYVNMTSDDYLIRDRIQQIYLNFALFGEPVPYRTELLNTTWPPKEVGTDSYLNFGRHLAVGRMPIEERLSFWDELYASPPSETDSATRNDIVTSTIFTAMLMIAFR